MYLLLLIAGMFFEFFAFITLNTLLSHMVGELDFHAFRRIQFVVGLIDLDLATRQYFPLFFE
jgi:hypothetical protein